MPDYEAKARDLYTRILVGPAVAVATIKQALKAAHAAGRREGLEAAFAAAFSTSAVAGAPVKGERNDYADGYRYAAASIQSKIHALKEGDDA